MPHCVKLSATEVIKLITEVNKRPCIWDVSNIDYKNRKKVLRAWRNIASLLNVRDYILQATWKNLRDTLNRELKRYNMKAGDKYPGKWQHFDRLHFMHEHYNAKSSDDEDYNRTKALLHHSTHDIYADESNNSTLYEDLNIPDTEYFEVTDELSKSNREPEDFDMMFLKSLLPFFHLLEPHRKLKVRSQIQNLIFHEFTDKKILIEVAGIQ